MKLPVLIRRAHRAVSMWFTLSVAANFVAMALKPGDMPHPLITYGPLPPLLILTISGLYMFVLPWLPPKPSDPELTR